jgi:hypothetical protein
MPAYVVFDESSVCFYTSSRLHTSVDLGDLSQLPSPQNNRNCALSCGRMARSSKKKGKLSPSLGPVAGSERGTTSSTPTTMTTPVKEEDSFSLHSPSSPTAPLMDVDLKLESHMSPSQSPTLAEATNEKMKPSPTPASPAITMNGTKSETQTPPPSLQASFSSGNLKKLAGAAVQLIGDLPVARGEALKTFCEINENNYQYRTLGRCKELSESMTCDCAYEHGELSVAMEI